jgi:cyclohexanone monooxygenase
MGRALIRRQVPDPELREKVTPDYRIGCKRILISNEWYPALMRSNVDVETSGIAEVTETGICTKDGRLIEVDAILFGTGFAVNDWPMAKWARGDGGRTLKDVWGGKMASYRGTTVAGFPNMMLLVGPNTGLGHTSQVYMIEAQIAYIADAIRQMHENNWAVIEPKSDAQWEFDESVQRRMKKTVWVTGGCSSWYIDDEGRNTTLWPDFTFRFKRQMKKFDAAAYHVTTSDELRERSHQPQQASQVRAKAS